MKFILSLLSFFIALVGFSQATTAFPMQESSLLWKIEGPGIQKGSYLFGTMHLIEKQYFIFPDKLEKIVKKTDKLVMELAGLPNQLEALKYVTLTDGTFADYFSKEQMDSILVWAKAELNMSEEAFTKTMSKMKPFVVVQMATQIHFMGKTESYEMSFEKIARENDITIAGFETIAEQMGIFDKMTKEQQTEMVMETIRDPKKGIEVTQKMQKLYQGQNVDSLYLMIQEEGGTITEDQATILDDRNERWIPMIEEMAKKEKLFIAVGAGHLGGPKGVIRLLEQKGYTLTPVKI
ncbi:MAG: TraB/GumN family protein [Crocinitomicaceae bacterium]|nr:TraB/GumN family protein [Crocinitomicaceae bacterium]MCF8433444.1 TraB/GumN family protein [Crocinitomicaceae bacterium]